MRRDYLGASNTGFRVRNWFSFILLLGLGYLILATQARAIGASSIDADEKIYLTSSSTTGEKTLLEASMLIIAHCETKKVYRHSDFLTITRNRIYKAQNDP